jgi:YHS domain-containing protein
LSPLRILILAILLFILFRLLVGARRKKKGVSAKTHREVPLNDVLEEDPVCHKLVPRQQAIQYQSQGKTYYFCSEKCCTTFSKEQGDRK